MPSGQWVQISLTYNGTLLSLFVNGQLEAEINHEGYLSWGDGTDHSLYLNRYAQTGMEGKAIFDDVRIYNRSLDQNEIELLWSAGDSTGLDH